MWECSRIGTLQDRAKGVKDLEEKVVISLVGSRLENKGGESWRKLES